MDDEEVDEIFDGIVTDVFDHDHATEVQRQGKRIRRVWLLRQVAEGVVWASIAIVVSVVALSIVVILTTLVLGLVLSGW